MPIDKKYFYDTIRPMFGGKLTQTQVSSMDKFIDSWEKNYSTKDAKQFAYILATTFHETARTMLPVVEYGTYNYFMSNYDITGEKPQLATRLGNTSKGDGFKYRGRGYVQLTGKTNYDKASKLVGFNLVENPDLACNVDIARTILFEGMFRGLFTGKNLDDYFKETKDDWVNARRIINGTDKAGTIADYAKVFYKALTKTN